MAAEQRAAEAQGAARRHADHPAVALERGDRGIQRGGVRRSARRAGGVRGLPRMSGSKPTPPPR
jgi:hypothetical protein